MRQLLERVREADKLRLAERAARERDACRTILRVEAGRERRRDDVLERAAGNDDAREARFGRRAGAAVAREEQRVVVVARAGHPVRAVTHLEDRAARPRDVIRAFPMVAYSVSARCGRDADL